MRENKETLERKFSDFGELQSPKKLTYACRENVRTPGEYAVCVCESKEDALHREETVCFKSDESTAKNVLTFLYENAVTPPMLWDILRDLREQGFLAMKG